MWLSKIKSLFSNKIGPAITGRVKFFNRRRGYGFIESEQLDSDVFVHVSDLEDSVSRGDRVRFDIENSPKGPEARNVRVINA